ncbi:hypothetical protein H6P81_009080 [Aristolochia fimbriata]|uniref:PUM-HD domain-containing protein n=1 Tax=Aristolochia fimbriata TaxID=158543 RepID=A0AAV7EJT2_ARIFI|nr:hypothetical protein H6P81_009080 [Aristolochia fimbriata]
MSQLERSTFNLFASDSRFPLLFPSSIRQLQYCLVSEESGSEYKNIQSGSISGELFLLKVIETLKTHQQISLLVSALEPGFLHLIKDLNGNHVVQCFLQCLSSEDNKDRKVLLLEHVFIRCSKIRFVVILDMLKNAPIFKRLDARIKGKRFSLGVGRGHAVAMQAKEMKELESRGKTSIAEGFYWGFLTGCTYRTDGRYCEQTYINTPEHTVWEICDLFCLSARKSMMKKN